MLSWPPPTTADMGDALEALAKVADAYRKNLACGVGRS